jgi:hypothetical protein
MSVLLYLLVPVIVVTIASVVIWYRGHKPTSLEGGIDSFKREMKALSPEAERRARRGGRPGGR